MDRSPDGRRKHARLIIALAVVGGGLVSISLSWLGKWTGIREPIQISRSHQAPAAPTSH